MNIVFFVDSYSRNASANGVCVKKVADELIAQGHQVTVFTSYTEHNQPPFEIVDGVLVYRMRRSSVDEFAIFVRNRKSGTVFWRRFLTYCIRIRYCLLVWFWPMTSFFSPNRYCKFAKKKIGNRPPDVIVGVYFHLEELLGSLKLKKYYPNSIHITYSLDAMAGRAIPNCKTHRIIKKAIKHWERYILGKTDIFCPMKSHRSHFFNANHPISIVNKICYVDIPLLDLKNEVAVKHEGINKRIVYTGYSTKESGSAKYLVELIPYLDDIEFHIYGAIDEEILCAIEKTGLYNKKIFFYGYVDHNTVSIAQNTADFLVTFGSINPCMISGKIFEYFSRKKPIIAFYQIEEDANLAYLKKYPNVLLIKDCPENYKEDALKLNAFLHREDFIQIDNEFLLKNYYDNTPLAMAKQITAIGEGKDG